MASNFRVSDYNYEHFDAYVERGADERDFGCFPDTLHAGERASARSPATRNRRHRRAATGRDDHRLLALEHTLAHPDPPLTIEARPSTHDPWLQLGEGATARWKRLNAAVRSSVGCSAAQGRSDKGRRR
jgi:hypothetical protein